MPYAIAPTDLNELAAALAEYYDRAWQDGIKGLADNMARGHMGIVRGYLDQAKDTYPNLKKLSTEFGVTCKAALKQQVQSYLANKYDVATDLTNIAETALQKLADKIPVPLLGTIVSKGIEAAAGKTREELHTRSIDKADEQLGDKTGAELGRLFTNNAEATAYVEKSMEQYKLICRYIQTLPGTISTFDDAVTYPAAAFRVQKAASSLNVALVSVRQYLAGMQERLDQIHRVSKDYMATVRGELPRAADNVLQDGYRKAYQRGENDLARGKYAAPPAPVFRKPDKRGGATLLAAYLANAVAQGYHDSGNRGPMTGRPRGA